MNCAECRENLVACVEGLLDAEPAAQCRAHLEGCAACRAEYEATAVLHQRLTERGRTAAEVSLVQPVMRRVRHVQTEREGSSIMKKLFSSWGLGLGAAAAASIVFILILASPKAHATASDMLARGARALAGLRTIHLQGQLRTAPNDNFSYIDPKCDFCAVELWKEFAPELKWRAEKPGRVAAMDGKSTLMYIKPANLAMKFPQPSRSAFDTEWLHRMANLSNTITNELLNAQARGWKLSLARERGTDGRAKSVVTVNATSGLPENDYLKNKFIDSSDTRRVYRFDDETELLEGVQVYLETAAGEVLIFELRQIEYNQNLDPAVFEVQLPADVRWYKDEMPVVANNEKYAAMTPEQAARAYFEALGRADWTEAEKFRRDAVGEQTKPLVTGLQVVSIGTAFSSKAYDPSGRFVPYEIKLGDGKVIKHNIALKKDARTGRWFVDGGGF